MKKFIALLTVAAVVFANIGCGGETPKAKETPKPAEKKEKA